jgi:hypothetical protein
MKKINVILVLTLLVLSCEMGFSQRREFTGAEIYTRETFLYGKIEFEMRAVKRSGVLSNFFTYKNGSERNDVLWEEIDVEIFGRRNASRWETNLIYEDVEGQRIDNNDRTHGSDRRDFSRGLTRFTIEWRPNDIRWYESGRLVRRETGVEASRMDEAHSLRFNIWASSNVGFAGEFDETDLSSPGEMIVDYIRYFPYNAANDTFASTPSFSDEFGGSRLDAGKWNVGTHTFESNLARFRTENVRVSGGRLRLRFDSGITTSNSDPTIERSSKANATTKAELTEATLNSISIHPNPVKSTFNLNTNGFEVADVFITDLTGKLVYQNTIANGILKFNTVNFGSGLYVVKVVDKNNIPYTTKFVIE